MERTLEEGGHLAEQDPALKTELVATGEVAPSQEQQRTTSIAVQPQAGSLVPSGTELQVMMQICQAFVTAKMLPGHFNTPEKALAAVLTGRDLGLSPTAAWRGLYPVDNTNDQGERTGVTLGMMVDLQMSLATSRVPGFYIDIKEQTPERVEIWFHRSGWPVLKVVRTAQWAHKCGLPMKRDGRTLRTNWARDFAGMLTARVKSIGLHQIAADVLAGLYPPDEIAEYQEAAPKTDDGNGKIVDATNFKEVE